MALMTRERYHDMFRSPELRKFLKEEKGMTLVGHSYNTLEGQIAVALTLNITEAECVLYRQTKGLPPKNKYLPKSVSNVNGGGDDQQDDQGDDQQDDQEDDQEDDNLEFGNNFDDSPANDLGSSDSSVLDFHNPQPGNVSISGFGNPLLDPNYSDRLRHGNNGNYGTSDNNPSTKDSPSNNYYEESSDSESDDADKPSLPEDLQTAIKDAVVRFYNHQLDEDREQLWKLVHEALDLKEQKYWRFKARHLRKIEQEQMWNSEGVAFEGLQIDDGPKQDGTIQQSDSEDIDRRPTKPPNSAFSTELEKAEDSWIEVEKAKERAEVREKAEKEEAEKEQAEKEQAMKDKAEKEKAEKDKGKGKRLLET